MVKKFKVVKIEAPNGEVHYLLRSLNNLNSKQAALAKDFDKEQVKIFMKKEARKQLFLMRSE